MLYIRWTAILILPYHASAMACKICEVYLQHLVQLQSNVFCTLTSSPTLLFKSALVDSKFVFDDYCSETLAKNLTYPYKDCFGFIVSRGYDESNHHLHRSAHSLKRVSQSFVAAKNFFQTWDSGSHTVSSLTAKKILQFAWRKLRHRFQNYNWAIHFY